MKVQIYSDTSGVYGLCLEPDTEHIEHQYLWDNSLLKENVHVLPMSGKDMVELGIAIAKHGLEAEARGK